MTHSESRGAALFDLLTLGRGPDHPGPRKEATAGRPIEDLPPPAEVVLPLVQHLGDPAVPVVKKGDVVRRGQKIAEAAGSGVPLHATINGKVKSIDKQAHPTLVQAQAIVLARVAEAEATDLEFPEDPAWRALERDEMLARIREAGIVGLGGAAFPTFRKLRLPPGVTVDTLIVNGAECEPYLTSDYRLMLAEPRAIVEGARLLARIVGVHARPVRRRVGQARRGGRARGGGEGGRGGRPRARGPRGAGALPAGRREAAGHRAHRPRDPAARAALRGARGGAERGDRGRGARRRALPPAAARPRRDRDRPRRGAAAQRARPDRHAALRPGALLRRPDRRAPRAWSRAAR